ncbi:MAG: hypothetical protein DYH08_09905 [Actinobacteria bacterium ATB1]|nr:hypothetical protein [Actinobacteria bacterium ATB1]
MWMSEPHLVPEDVLLAVSHAETVLGPLTDGDWTSRAGKLDWDCARTLNHVIDCIEFYAAHLATRAERLRWVRTGRNEKMGPKDLLVDLRTKSHVLAAVATASPGVRAYHPRGFADAEGFVGMACDEVLLHTADIAAGLDPTVDPRPPEELTRRLLRRLFPWTQGVDTEDCWATLLWANDRANLNGSDRIGAEWTWWCAPLEEWDGKLPSRPDPLDPPGRLLPQGKVGR